MYICVCVDKLNEYWSIDTSFMYDPTAVDYIKDLVQDKNSLKERMRELQTVLGEM